MADTPKSTSLTAFENLVFGGKHSVALSMLLRMLDSIERGGELPQSGIGEGRDQAYFTRFAAAITTLLAMDPAPLTPQIADRLALHNRHITALFRLSGFADPGHLYRMVQAAHGARSDEAAVARNLAAVTVDAAVPINWQDLLPKLPSAASSAYLAQFAHRAPLSAAAERQRNALLDFAPLLEGYALRDTQLPLLCQAWMFCSYLTSPSRHALKLVLNRLVADWLVRAGVNTEVETVAAPEGDRPVLVVTADVMMSWHAMYKTYANFLKQLRARFRLVLVCLADRTDDAARALFDDVHEIPDSARALSDIVATIRTIGPAILYYPSVGMSVLTVQLCNLRLARIQVASVGHPATTNAPMIDYMVMGHTYYSDAARYSERVLLLQSTGALFEPTLGAAAPEPVLRDAPERLRIAVSSSTLKLNATFLTLCAEIEATVRRPIEFHFFPNEQGIRLRDCAHQVHRFLPQAVVHERTGYDDYLVLLNRCDIRLGTFPFGGANTTMDAYLLAIPTITMTGPEPHSRTDARFATLFELPDWLVTENEEGYRNAAVRMIDDDALRIAVSRSIFEADPAKMLFENEQVRFPTDFADTLWWTYTHHEAIRKTKKRVWGYEDRVALAGHRG